ncbi:MAG: ABC transporter ATP-binding protein, partial [Streptosporangiales bacterium]|nr:ABC transporter ATP-binding protein [Streptosporangiales bacterium]
MPANRDGLGRGKDVRVRGEDRLLLRAARGAGGLPVLFAVAAVLAALADLVLPYLLGRTLDAVLAPGGRTGPWLAACLAVLAVLAVCEAVADLTAAAGSVAATAWLRRTLTRHVLALGADATRWRGAGDLTGRITGNADEAGAAAPAAVTALAAVIPTVGGLAALAWIDVWLAVCFGVGLAVLMPLLRIFVRDASAEVAGYQQAQGELAGRLLGAVRGGRTIAAAAAARTEADRVLVPLARLRRHGAGTWRAQARLTAQ